MRFPTIAVLCSLALAPLVAHAQQADNRLRDALRSATAQLRALEDEKAQWQAKEAQHKKELEALRADLEAARKGAASRGDERAVKRQLSAQLEASAKATEALARCQKEAEENVSSQQARVKEAEEERSRAASRLEDLGKRAAACEERNARMSTAGKEFAAWVAKASGTVCEPILGLRRVELEKRAQDLEDRLLESQAGAPVSR